MSEDSRTALPDGPDWTFELLDVYQKEIERVAKHYRLSTYPNQIEIITAEQMMDAYSSVGMPIGYHHWSFGKNSSPPSSTTSVVRWDWRMKLLLTPIPVFPI